MIARFRHFHSHYTSKNDGDEDEQDEIRGIVFVERMDVELHFGRVRAFIAHIHVLNRHNPWRHFIFKGFEKVRGSVALVEKHHGAGINAPKVMRQSRASKSESRFRNGRSGSRNKPPAHANNWIHIVWRIYLTMGNNQRTTKSVCNGSLNAVRNWIPCATWLLPAGSPRRLCPAVSWLINMKPVGKFAFKLKGTYLEESF